MRLLSTSIIFGEIIALLILAPSVSSAQTVSVVVPNELSEVEGGVPSVVPDVFTNGDRFQELFPAEQFSDVPPTHRWITAIYLRPDSNLTDPFSQEEDFLVQLSSTDRTVDTLELDFAENHGTDLRTVLDGSLTLSSATAGPPAGPREFDLLIDFESPFLYNPRGGLNLLVDVTERGERSPIALDRHDVFGTSGIFAASDSEATATLRIPGAVMQFEFSPVPEPSSTALALLGTVLGLASLRRRA